MAAVAIKFAVFTVCLHLRHRWPHTDHFRFVDANKSVSVNKFLGVNKLVDANKLIDVNRKISQKTWSALVYFPGSTGAKST